MTKPTKQTPVAPLLNALCITEADDGGWICSCGNTPSDDGFYPCDRQGQMVEPTKKDWTTGWYVCDQCGRMIDCANLLVVGYRPSNTLTPVERRAITLGNTIADFLR